MNKIDFLEFFSKFEEKNLKKDVAIEKMTLKKINKRCDGTKGIKKKRVFPNSRFTNIFESFLFF